MGPRCLGKPFRAVPGAPGVQRGGWPGEQRGGGAAREGPPHPATARSPWREGTLWGPAALRGPAAPAQPGRQRGGGPRPGSATPAARAGAQPASPRRASAAPRAPERSALNRQTSVVRGVRPWWPPAGACPPPPLQLPEQSRGVPGTPGSCLRARCGRLAPPAASPAAALTAAQRVFLLFGAHPAPSTPVQGPRPWKSGQRPRLHVGV